MIINTGQRTDIPAFYAEWFANRLREGFVCVRNPYNPNQVSRYRLDPSVVDVIGFCSKNPAPMFPYMNLMKDYGQYWFVTITPYGRDIEPNVPDKRRLLDDFRRLSGMVGVNSIGWRYDPIIISERYSADYHLRAFEQMAAALDGYDAELDCKSNDEVGVLTDTFSSMRDSLKAQFTSLSGKAFRDDLTGVKSKHAYVEAEENLDRRIDDHNVTEFAIALFDLNNLKEVNDSQGHDAGDAYIKESSRLICTCFKHSPVYRIGGDEFVAILEGEDYDHREELLAAFEKQMDDNLTQGKRSISSGCACFDPAQDKSAHTVLERADERMYQRKRQMKEREGEE